MTRALLLKLALVLWLLAGLRTGWAGGADPLVFGVFPYATARQIVETYRPVANALEKQLHRPVLLYTARDFTTFAERTRQGEYDILLTASHLAWLARQETAYRPLLKYVQPIRGLLVVKSDSPFKSLEAMRGHVIATADSIALVVLAMKAEMTAQGLSSNIDYRPIDAVTHVNAAIQVVNGRADAAMLGQRPYKIMRPELRRQLRVLAETPPLPSLVYLVHPRLPDTESQAIRTALLAFSSSPEGHALTPHGGMGPVDHDELLAIRPYAVQAQEMLRTSR